MSQLCWHRGGLIVVVAPEAGCIASSAWQSDIALCLEGSDTVYFASGDVWQEVLEAKPKTKATRQVMRPLWDLGRKLRAGGVAFATPRSVEHILIGTGNFRSPPNLGPVVADTLYVVRLRSSADVRLEPKYRCAQCDHEGAEFWRWTTGSDVTPTVAAKRDGLLFIGTNETIVSQALRVREGMSTMDPELRELFRKARNRNIWAVRVYNRRDYNDRLAAGLQTASYEISKDARWTQIEMMDQERFVVRYSSTSFTKGPLAALETTGKTAKRVQAGGVWEIDVESGDSDRDVGAALTVMGLLGFGIYL